MMTIAPLPRKGSGSFSRPADQRSFERTAVVEAGDDIDSSTVQPRESLASASLLVKIDRRDIGDDMLFRLAAAPDIDATAIGRLRSLEIAVVQRINISG